MQLRLDYADVESTETKQVWRFGALWLIRRGGGREAVALMLTVGAYARLKDLLESRIGGLQWRERGSARSIG